MRTAIKADLWQQTFALSLLSNCLSNCVINEALSDDPATYQQELEAARVRAQHRLTDMMQQTLRKQIDAVGYIIGTDWQLVWGPQVFVQGPTTSSGKQASFTSTNAMYVAYRAAGYESGQVRPAQYVIAIAATNGASRYDWIKEDFSLSPGMDWNLALERLQQSDPSPLQALLAEAETLAGTLLSDLLHPLRHQPAISTGSFIGLHHLLDMKHDAVPLLTFLNNRPDTTANITVAGHSLGGALSPLLGLALIDPDKPLLYGPKPMVNVYATAGATPGNVPFAKRYLSSLPPSCGAKPWQVWNAVISNQFDLVASAWNQSTLKNWKNSMQDCGSYQSVAAKLEIDLMTSLLLTNAEVFAAQRGELAHLVSDSVPAVLNPGVAPEDGMYFDFDNVLMTKPQAQLSGTSASGKAISAGDQVHCQHVLAYLQLIFEGIPLPTLGSADGCP